MWFETPLDAALEAHSMVVVVRVRWAIAEGAAREEEPPAHLGSDGIAKRALGRACRLAIVVLCKVEEAVRALLARLVLAPEEEVFHRVIPFGRRPQHALLAGDAGAMPILRSG